MYNLFHPTSYQWYQDLDLHLTLSQSWVFLWLCFKLLSYHRVQALVFISLSAQAPLIWFQLHAFQLVWGPFPGIKYLFYFKYIDLSVQRTWFQKFWSFSMFFLSNFFFFLQRFLSSTSSSTEVKLIFCMIVHTSTIFLIVLVCTFISTVVRLLEDAVIQLLGIFQDLF